MPNKAKNRKWSTVIATVVAVDDYGARAETKSINDEPVRDDPVLWGIPKELEASVHDDIVITMSLDMSRFVSFRNASTGKLHRLR